MKNTFLNLLLLIFFLPVKSFGQETIFEIISNAKQMPDEIKAIYDLNVFEYFHLNEYNSELKMSVFKKTEEYQIKFVELKNIKSGMFKSTYFIKMENAINDYVNYDLKNKGFAIEIGSNEFIMPVMAKAPKTVQRILFKSLPTFKKYEPLLGPGIYIEKLLIKMSEINGLEVEQAKENIDIYFLFTPSGKEKTTYKYYNNSGNSWKGWYTRTDENIKSDSVRVITANNISGKIYSDQIFKLQIKTIKRK